MGVVSAAGIGAEASLESMLSGTRNVGPISVFESPLELPVFEVRELPPRRDPRKMRTLELLEIALDEALADAGLSADGLAGLRVGAVFGTSVACQLNDLDFYAAFRSTGAAPLDSVEGYLSGHLAEAVVRRFGLSGPALVVANACSSGTDALGVGMEWIRSGRCDVVLAGGADEMNRVPVDGFNALGVASSEPCRPFDAGRSGLNLGEGAGVLVLESDDSAARRGRAAKLRALGYGASADAHHLTAPHPEGAGLKRAVGTALRDAGLAPDDVAFVNAHGTSTHDNDRVEGRALLEVFGEDVAVLSTKGYVGHALGAAGAIEAVFSALSLRAGTLPASAGFERVDPEIGLTPLTENRPVSGRYALSTSLAFGGNNAALVLGVDS